MHVRCVRVDRSGGAAELVVQPVTIGYSPDRSSGGGRENANRLHPQEFFRVRGVVGSSAKSTSKSRSDAHECASSSQPSRGHLLASHSRLPRSTSLRAGASKSDPYYERRVVSSPSARYAGLPSLPGSPSYYQYGPAQSVGPAQWPRDDVSYARPAPPRHPFLTQMASEAGSGGGGGGGGGGGSWGGSWAGHRSRGGGGSLPLMHCAYVESTPSMAGQRSAAG